MEWRCEWCGKPHEENDPPCDNCGHGSFEKAVVRGPAAESGPDSTVVWACTECGREHTKNSPPCSRCNNATLERQRKEITEENLTEVPGDARPDPAVGAETTVVWVCTECGREHPKHSPPCSRCGAPDLEREEKGIGTDELSAPSYFDLVTPQYAAVLGVVLLIAGVAVLGFAGIIDVPFITGGGVPDAGAVPGEAERVEGLALSDVEAAYLNELNSRQAAAGGATLARSGYLDEVAEYYHQQVIAAQFGDGGGPDRGEISELLAEECSGRTTIVDSSATVDGRSADALGADLASQLPTPLDVAGTTTGIDAHYVDGELLVLQFACEG
jgi:hypothetical protein